MRNTSTIKESLARAEQGRSKYGSNKDVVNLEYKRNQKRFRGK